MFTTGKAKFHLLDDMDSGVIKLPASQAKVLRRICSHANPDGTGSHPSYVQLATECGWKSAHAKNDVRKAIVGDKRRRWLPLLGWLIVEAAPHVQGSRKAREYRILERHERASASSVGMSQDEAIVSRDEGASSVGMEPTSSVGMDVLVSRDESASSVGTAIPTLLPTPVGNTVTSRRSLRLMDFEDGSTARRSRSRRSDTANDGPRPLTDEEFAELHRLYEAQCAVEAEFLERDGHTMWVPRNERLDELSRMYSTWEVQQEKKRYAENAAQYASR